jgi:hypothetical protein
MRVRRRLLPGVGIVWVACVMVLERKVEAARGTKTISRT